MNDDVNRELTTQETVTHGGGTAEAAGQQAVPRVRGFTILGQLGKGGMGIVYEAQQEMPARRVALKLIHPGLLGNADRVRRFEREIVTLARLRHPGIASLYQAGRTEDGQLFFAMELIEGLDLSRYVQRYPLERGREAIDARARLFLALCDAVHHAHKHEVIHRDLKPDNILVACGEDVTGAVTEQPKVLDFGLARKITEDPAESLLTIAGAVHGTLAYMSPEQASGKAVTETTDIYSLGVILYQLVTGVLPYDLSRKPIHECVRLLCESPPVPPSHHWNTRPIRHGAAVDAEAAETAEVQDVPDGENDGASSGIQVNRPRDLEVITLKCLAKNPDHRYASAAELARDLRCYLAELPIGARPPNLTLRANLWLRRHFALALAATAVLATALLGLAAVAASLAWQNQQVRGNLSSAYVWAHDAVDRPAASLLYAAAALEAEDTAEARGRLLTSYRAARSGGLDLDLGFGILAPLQDEEGFLLANRPGIDGRVRIVELVRPAQLRELTVLERGWEPRLADPGSRRLVCTSEEDRAVPRIVDLESAEHITLGTASCVGLTNLTLDPSRLWLAASDPGNHDVLVWALEAHAPPTRLSMHSDLVRTLAFSADGSRMASLSEDQGLVLWETATWVGRVLSPAGRRARVDGLVFSPDGELLAWGAGDRTRVLDTGDGTTAWMAAGLPLRFLEQGEQLELAVPPRRSGQSIECGPRVILAVDTGELIRHVPATAAEAEPWHIAWSTDSGRGAVHGELVARRQRLSLAGLSRDDYALELPLARGIPAAHAFTGDGRELLAVTTEGLEVKESWSGARAASLEVPEQLRGMDLYFWQRWLLLGERSGGAVAAVRPPHFHRGARQPPALCIWPTRDQGEADVTELVTSPLALLHDPQTSHLMLVSPDGGVQWREHRSGKLVRELSMVPPPRGLSMAVASADGNMLIFASTQHAHVLGRDLGRLQELEFEHLVSISLSREGDLLAGAEHQGAGIYRRSSGGKFVLDRMIKARSGSVREAVLDPAGELIIFSVNEGIWIHRVCSGDAVCHIPVPSGSTFADVEITPDGRHLALLVGSSVAPRLAAKMFIHPLEPLDWPAADSLRRAEIWSGHRLSGFTVEQTPAYE